MASANKFCRVTLSMFVHRSFARSSVFRISPVLLPTEQGSEPIAFMVYVPSSLFLFSLSPMRLSATLPENVTKFLWSEQNPVKVNPNVDLVRFEVTVQGQGNLLTLTKVFVMVVHV